jgi:hypothetical protein
MKRLIILYTLLLIQCSVFSVSHVSASEPVKILFIGSSYFNFNKLPALFQNLVAQSPFEVEIDSYLQNGLSLADNASSSITEEKIKSRSWYYVISRQHHPPPGPTRHLHIKRAYIAKLSQNYDSIQYALGL